MMLKIPAITKICGCAELTDTLNTWREKIYNDYNNVVQFWNFYQLSRIDAKLFKTFQNITQKFSRDSLQFIILNNLFPEPMNPFFQNTNDLYYDFWEFSTVESFLSFYGTIIG